MLNTLHSWCKKWRVLINTDKSKCVHFRKNRAKPSEFVFTIGNNVLQTVDRYKYLGIIFQDRGSFEHNCETLAKGAGRALGKIISKIHNYKNFGFKSFTKLYDSCVTPILDYCSGVWGGKPFQSIDNVQHRAMRYIMGVHRFTPTLALIGDTGWLPSTYRRWIAMIRYYNRLIKFDDNRLTKQVFIMDYNSIKCNWSSNLKSIMQKLDLMDSYNNRLSVNLPNVTTKIMSYYSNLWKSEMEKVPKLRSYILFKMDFSCESYLQLNLKKNERALLAQLRCGILPLRIETGRYLGEPLNTRLCKLCKCQEIESEEHFILRCTLYDRIRDDIYSDIFINQFLLMSHQEQFIELIQKYPRKTAKFVVNAYMLRRSILFN